MVLPLVLAVSLILTMSFRGVTQENTLNARDSSPTAQDARKTLQSSKLGELVRWYSALGKVYQQHKIQAHELLVISAHCASAKFIRFKHQALKQFSELPFRLVIMDDTNSDTDPEYLQRMQECRKHPEIIHLRIPPLLHQHRQLVLPLTEESFGPVNPSLRNCVGVGAAWKIMTCHLGYGMVLDEDCLPIRRFHPENFLNGKQACGSTYTHDPPNIPKYRNVHIDFSIWNLRLMNDAHLINWDCGQVMGDPVDAGGQTAHWLMKHEADFQDDPGLSDSDIPEIAAGRAQFGGNEIKYGSFLHFRRASNWSQDAPEEYANRFDYFESLCHIIFERNRPNLSVTQI